MSAQQEGSAVAAALDHIDISASRRPSAAAAAAGSGRVPSSAGDANRGVAGVAAGRARAKANWKKVRQEREDIIEWS
jgi:hypothetical protein